MKRFLILLVLALILVSCGKKEVKEGVTRNNTDPSKPMAWGHKQTIYVFADEENWRATESQLRRTLERVVFTTANEKVFELKRATFDDFEHYYKFNNLIFLADYSSYGDVSVYIKDIMGDKVKAELEENGVGIYPNENLWANDQFVLFIIAEDKQVLKKAVSYQLNEVYNLFKKKLDDRIAHKVLQYNSYKKTFFLNFPWEIHIPEFFRVFSRDDDNNFIAFIARADDKPDRYEAIYHEDMSSDEVDGDWLKAKRLELFRKYYEGDEFYDKDVRIERTILAGRDGWKLSGKWQNPKLSMGGAFQCFGFYDKTQKKAYVIDNSVYYPTGEKLAHLLELEAISGTIKLKDLSKIDNK